MTAQEIVRESIRRGARQVRTLATAEGALALVVFAGGFLLVEIALDHSLTLSAGTRTVFLAFLVAGAVALTMSLILVPLIRSVSALYVAHRIETAFPHFKNSLVTFVEIDRGDANSEIAPLVAIQAARGLEGVDVAAGLDSTRFTRLGYGLVALVIAVAFYGAVVPKSMWVSALRAVHPWADIPAPTRLLITDVVPGSTRVPVGTSIAVTARVTGGTPENVSIRWSRDGELWQAAPMRKADGAWAGVLEHIETNILYAIRADEAVSQKYAIAALARPVVESVTARVAPPEYTGLPSCELSGGNVKAAEGSIVNLTIRSNKELARAELRFGKTKSIPLAASGRSADGTFRLEASGQYTIALEDADGLSPANPLTYEITSIPDAAPEVAMAGPPADELRGLDDPFDFEFFGNDDYGLTRLVFHYESDPSNADAKAFAVEPAMKHVGEAGRYSARDLGARPGDKVTYYVEGYDNRAGRPNVARSEVHTFQVAATDSRGVGFADGARAKPPASLATQTAKKPGSSPYATGTAKAAEGQEDGFDAKVVAQAKDKLGIMMEADKDAWQAIMKNLPGIQGAQTGTGQAPSAQASQEGQSEANGERQPPTAQVSEGKEGTAPGAKEKPSESEPAGEASEPRETRPEGDRTVQIPVTPDSQAPQPAAAGQSPPTGSLSESTQTKASSQGASGDVRPGDSQQQGTRGGAQPTPGTGTASQSASNSATPPEGKQTSTGAGQTGEDTRMPGAATGTSSETAGPSGGHGQGQPRRDTQAAADREKSMQDGGFRPPAADSNAGLGAARQAVQQIQGQLARGSVDPGLLKDLGWTPSELRTFVTKYQDLLGAIETAASAEGRVTITAEPSGAPGGVVAGARGAGAVGALDSSGAKGIARTDDVPREEVAPEYRAIVDEYYRSLAEGRR